MDDGGECVEYVVSLGLSVSKEEIEKASERLCEPEGGNHLDLARVELKGPSQFRENCREEFCLDKVWRVGTSKKSSEGFLLARLIGGSSLVRAIILMLGRN